MRRQIAPQVVAADGVGSSSPTAGGAHRGGLIVWGCWTVALALPWLIGLHPDPWSSFYNDIAAAASVLLLAALLVWRRQRLRIDAAAVVLTACACIPLLQAASGMFALPAEAPIIALYVFGMGCAVALGHTAQARFAADFGTALFTALAGAAVISATLGFAQLMHLDLGVLLAPVVHGSRPYANVGQPNELATLLVLGSIAVLWLLRQRRIPCWLAVVLLAYLMLGVASTRSRTGWLEVALIHLVGVVSPAWLGLHFRRARLVVIGSLLLFVLTITGWEMAATALLPAGGPRLAAGLRPRMWRMVIDGIAHGPWLGYGWNQGRVMQLAVLPAHCDYYQEGFQYAHNIVLDLLVWNGIPMGAVLVAGGVWWFGWQSWRLRSGSDALMLLAILAFAVHASLELPHAKAFFLLPIGLLVGALNAQAGVKVLISLRPAALAALTVGLSLVVALATQDFLRISEDQRAYRVRTAWAGIAPVPPAPDIYILRSLQSTLATLRIEPAAGMDAETIERIEHVAQRYPIERSLLLYAKTSALNGNPHESLRTLTQLCLLFSDHVCDRGKRIWNMFRSGHPEAEVPAFPSVTCAAREKR